jgi:quercetin dioxygenase-like cupin family protein
MKQHCISWDAIPEKVAASGVGKRVLAGADISLVMVKVPAGIKADRHSHEQFVQVVSGTGLLETEQGSHPFGPGNVFHFPPDTWHSAHFASDTILIETTLAS